MEYIYIYIDVELSSAWWSAAYIYIYKYINVSKWVTQQKQGNPFCCLRFIYMYIYKCRSNQSAEEGCLGVILHINIYIRVWVYMWVSQQEQP